MSGKAPLTMNRKRGLNKHHRSAITRQYLTPEKNAELAKAAKQGLLARLATIMSRRSRQVPIEDLPPSPTR